jgi:TonB family protein
MNIKGLVGRSFEVRGTVVALHAFLLAVLVVFSVPAHAAGDRGIVSRVPASYPELAKRMKISGQVKVEATVDADGKVTAVKTISGNRMLSAAAEDAVKKWKFEAGPGVGTTEVDVNFALAN